MKPLLRVGVPLWSVLISSALLKICQTDCVRNCNSTQTASTIAATTTASTTASTTAATTTQGVTSGLPTSSWTHTSVYSTTSYVPKAINLQVTTFTTSSASLNWTKPTGRVDHFKVEWTNGTKNWTETTKGTSYTINNLTAGTRYNATVSTVAQEEQRQTVPFRTRPGKVEEPLRVHSDTSSILLNWTKPSGLVDTYLVRYNNIKIEVNTSSAVLLGLIPGTSYSIEITAVVESNLTGEPNTFHVETKPAVVKSLNVDNVTTSSVSLSWEKPDGSANSYTIHLNGVNKINTTNTSFVIEDLTPGSEYHISVAAVTSNSTEGERASKTTFTRPEKPENIMLTEKGTEYLIIRWSLPNGNRQQFTVNINESGLQCDPTSTFSITEMDFKCDYSNTINTASITKSCFKCGRGNTTSTANITGLFPGRLFTITVSALAGIFTETSEEHQFATSPTPPGSIIVSQRTDSSLSLEWATPALMGSATDFSYHLTYKTEDKEMKTVNTSVNSTTLSDLSSGTLYNITLITVGVQNLKSTAVHNSVITLPKPVANLMVGDVSMTAIQLAWERPGDRDYLYMVAARQASTVVHNDTTNAENYTFPNLTPGTLYDFEVFAVVMGVKSEVKSVSSETRPAPVTDVMVTGSTTDLSVSWTAAAGKVLSYTALLLRDNHLDKHVDVGNMTRRATFTTLTPGVYYCVVVTSKSANFETNSSEVCRATVPNPPGSISVESQNIHSINFSWPRPENMTHQQYNFTVSSNNRNITTPNNWFLLDKLQSGTLYNISVATLGVCNYQSTAVAAENYTRPHPVHNLRAVLVNKKSVNLTWEQRESKPHYSYVVQVFNVSNQIIRFPTAIIHNLSLGSLYNFTVISQTADGTQATPPTTITVHTEPDIVKPSVYSQGNSSLLVSWSEPQGSFEYYLVHINSSFQEEDRVETVPNTTYQYQFGNLSAGRLYSVQIAVRSGPINGTSEYVSNATSPNPPGPLDVLAKTHSSIDVTWEEAPLMTTGSFTYKLFINASEVPDRVPGTNTSHTFASLRSGTPYNISVLTVGVLDFESTEVHLYMVNTRPFNVNKLRVSSVGENETTVVWDHPEEYKESYRYNVTWNSSEVAFNTQIRDNTYTVSDLVPGTSYDFHVTTETFDGTQADSEGIKSCTDASPVSQLRCEGPNTADASLLLSWTRPRGRFSDFMVTVNGKEVIESTCCSHNLSSLRHNTLYTLTVETRSCGQSSTSLSQQCLTGITNPPNLQDFDSLVTVSEKTHNKFSIQIDPRLLNDTNGPITHVGVLVSSVLSGNISKWRTYLGKTYDDWKSGEALAYLATVKSVSTSRSSESQHTLHVGDDSKWEKYANGVLDPGVTYHYAVVVFTNLSLDKNLVNGEMSLVSSTDFYHTVNLSQDPVILIAIGATLGIFFVLFIILIGFIIYWRRLSQKEETDIQIHSMRAKVSVAVRMEDYEVYYRKQKADSNCGFAEEFEDLKPVGTDQPKTSALILENKPKNRYNNVLPYDSSRVKLSIIHGSPYDDYINANYMPGYNSKKEFIAAQGPLPATVSDFWRMIWEKNVQTLVMLTRCNEQGRVKCEQYWEFGTRHFENINVTTVSDIPLEDWTIRDFDVKNVKTAETRSVRQFHFTAWPDHGVPETTELLISFRHLVREHMDQYSRHSPTVVHCSAGVGRTGTFISIDRLIFQIERENIVDVYGIVHDLRMHRPLMVQTEDQYVFLNQCAMDIIRSRTGTNVDLIYQNTAALSIYENVDLHKGYYRYPDA